MSNITDIREKYKQKNEEFKISVVSPVCTRCQNFDISNPVARKCSAFPNDIPLEIWEGKNDHTREFAGDNGIRFTPIQKLAA